MSESEVLELALMSFDSIATQFGLILTLVFAYLAMAYLVGGRLTWFQTAVVSFLFVFGATILTMGLYGTMQRSISLVELLRELHPDQTFIMSRVFAYCLTTLLSLSIPVCLFFMHQIRGDPRLGAGR